MPRRRTGRPPGRPRYPGTLTPAEQRVLALLRLGRSNAEVATELGLGIAKVKFHVSNMLAKLNLASREGLAVWGQRDEHDRPAFLWLPSLRRITAGGAATCALVALVLVVISIRRTVPPPQPAPLTAAEPQASPPAPDALLFAEWGTDGGAVHALAAGTPADVVGQTPLPARQAVDGLVSPNGRLAALLRFQTQEGASVKLEILDIATFKARPVAGLPAGVSTYPLAWSPDSTTIYVDRTYENGITASNGSSLSHEVWAVDARTRSAGLLYSAGERSLWPVWLTPDGKALLALADDFVDHQPGLGSGRPYLLAIDAVDGHERSRLPLPGLLAGQLQVANGDSTVYERYGPTGVIDPAGEHLYLVHAESEAVTIVDLRSMTAHTRLTRDPASLSERVADWAFGGLDETAEAKGDEFSLDRSVAISPDGSRLYIGGRRESEWSEACAREPRVEACQSWEPMPIDVVDVDSMARLYRIEPGGEFALSPNGKRLYVFGWGMRYDDPEAQARAWPLGLRVFETTGFQQIASFQPKSIFESGRLDRAGRYLYLVEARKHRQVGDAYIPDDYTLHVFDTAIDRGVAARPMSGGGMFIR